MKLNYQNEIYINETKYFTSSVGSNFLKNHQNIALPHKRYRKDYAILVMKHTIMFFNDLASMESGLSPFHRKLHSIIIG
jgi:hypothetical protein